uniref:Uncharacterized protein n=1 Tax=Arundo donax TaxID=35708 RepID=A0A0A9H5Q1_ARUDO
MILKWSYASLELQALLDHKKSWGKGREWADES